MSQWVSQLVLHSGLELTKENESVSWLVIPLGCLPEYPWVSVLEFLTGLVLMLVSEWAYLSVYELVCPSGCTLECPWG